MPVIAQETGRGFNATESTSQTLTSAITAQSKLMFSQTIKKKRMGQMKSARFNLLFFLATPAINISPLTITVEFGPKIITLVSGGSLLAGQTGVPFRVVGEIINKSNTSQLAWARIEQNGTTLINLGSGNMGFKATEWFDLDTDTNDYDFKINASFGALALGTTLVLKHAAVELS